MSEENKPQVDTKSTKVESAAEAGRPSTVKRYLKRFGVAGFLFFLIKGLLWLIVPLVIAMGWFGGR